LVARGYLRRAARTAPDRLDIWIALCQVTERPQDRIECLERIVELDPTNVEAHAELQQLSSQEPAAPENALEEQAQAEPEADESSLPTEPPSPQVAGPPASGMRLDITDEMRQGWAETVAAGKPLVCIDHPHRETVLRCNQCDAPVCTDCVVRTPVGLRCKECVKAQQAIFFNALWYDYPLAALIALALSVPAASITTLIGWWFALIISPFAGALIGRAVHWATGRRRGRYIWLVVAVCMVLGAFAAWTVAPRALLTLGIYSVMATGAAVGALRLGRGR
jgi:hypothetical protein